MAYEHRFLRIVSLFCVTVLACDAGILAGQDLPEATRVYREGDFEKVVELADVALESSPSANSVRENWILLKCRAQLAAGEYADAKATLDGEMESFANSIRLREIAARVYRYNGDDSRANEWRREIGKLWQRSTWRYRDLPNMLTVGQFLLDEGYDPKVVLDDLYNPASKRFPNQPEVERAIGELALGKSDYQMAAKHFRKAIELDGVDPESHFGLAVAFRESNSTSANDSIQKVLGINPEHVGALLLQVERYIAEEAYDDAEKIIAKILTVNPHQADAWAYRAALAHLASRYEEEGRCRKEALKHWKSNPDVDHLIGLQLSRKYRFTEGVAYQRRALVMDKNYIPAKIQLAHDLLRLGQELEGWKLAEEVFDADQYNVVANNLVALRDNLGQFTTLEENGFVVRMDGKEADIYGRQVLDLLIDGEKKLATKYDVEIEKPVFVEIFPRQQDFAIRTFSLPGGDGFLGVCFGRVITMNSPAAQRTLTNWKSVLWHEFCHVVTLQKTKNKMPRWLSEGISVYEEQLAESGWGDRMSPTYREMILGEDLTPVSKLSSAFLKARTARHLQFAYFESSLVVRFIVEKFGEESLVRILDDLGLGVPINDAIARHTGPIHLLDKKFEEHITEQANAWGTKFDWERPDPPLADGEAWKKWLEDHPTSFHGLQELAQNQLKQSQATEALETIGKFEKLLLEDTRSRSAETIKAAAFRQLGQTEDETQALETVLKLNASQIDACLRLLEIYSQARDLENIKRMARLLQAINPLLKNSHRSLASVAEKQKDDSLVIESLSALASMGPLDLADTHYRLSAAQYRQGEFAAAKRNVLLALEAAPRYRDAHRLLLKIVQDQADEKSGSAVSTKEAEREAPISAETKQ